MFLIGNNDNSVVLTKQNVIVLTKKNLLSSMWQLCSDNKNKIWNSFYLINKINFYGNSYFNNKIFLLTQIYYMFLCDIYVVQLFNKVIFVTIICQGKKKNYGKYHEYVGWQITWLK